MGVGVIVGEGPETAQAYSEYNLFYFFKIFY